MLFLTIYIIQVYINDGRYKEVVKDGETMRVAYSESNSFALVLLLGLIIPAILCMLQISILGLVPLFKGEYPMNMYFDMVYITLHLINLLIQNQMDP